MMRGLTHFVPAYRVPLASMPFGSAIIDTSGPPRIRQVLKGTIHSHVYLLSDIPYEMNYQAPVHQMQQYYRVGVLDNCSGKWNALVDCLTLKTKRSSELEEILETREKEKSHIWTFRTPEEAASYWRELFGDPDEVE